PALVHLPSGRAVRLSDPAAARAAARTPAEEGPFARALSILAADGVLADDTAAPLDVYTFPVRDVHVLRAFLARAAHVPEEPAPFVCENCGAPFEAAPSSLLEVGTLLVAGRPDSALAAP